jgi:hypothetical protein
MDWHDSLRRIRALKLELARLDPRGGMPIAPPAGASEAAMKGVERRLGFALPPSYRALLAVHDGWPNLFSGASLLGVRALARGSFVDVARMVVEECGRDEAGEGALQDELDARCRKGWRNSLIPFGIDGDAETIFAWDVEAPRHAGELEVILWTNDIGVRLASFPELVDLVLDMLTAELDDRRRSAAAAVDVTPRSPAVVPRSRAGAAASRVPATPSSAVRSWAVG